VDCDVYDSTKTIFDVLKRRIRDGTVVVFDELCNYPGFERGELRAFVEFLQETGRAYEIIGMNGSPDDYANGVVEQHRNQPVAVRVL
jgi:putative intracellular protease/amidase